MFRAVAALSGGEVLARAAAFVATTLLARRLGPEGLGILAFAAAVSGYLALSANSSIQEIGAREIARAPGRATELYASVTLVQLLVAAGAYAVVAGSAMALALLLFAGHWWVWAQLLTGAAIYAGVLTVLEGFPTSVVGARQPPVGVAEGTGPRS